MKQPLMFRKLLNHWMTAPKLLDAGIENGYVPASPERIGCRSKGFPQFLI